MKLTLAMLCLLITLGAFATPAEDFAWMRTRTTRTWVALTFDCCQTLKPAGYDEAIVKTLQQTRTPATFFLGGRWIEAHPQAMKQLAGCNFFELANHSYLHPHFPKLTAAQVQSELSRTQELITRYGRTGRFMRPPYGEYDRQTLAVARQLGLRTVTWSISTGDPDQNTSAGEILQAVKRAKPGDIIIMHANGRGWHTAEALPKIIAYLRERGLKPVTLSALLGSAR